MTSVLVIDNYDSFTYNLVQYLGELGAEVGVVRNDKAAVPELLGLEPDRLVVSPGPCTPKEAGISVEAVRSFAEEGIPVLGVCLGHQSLVEAFGGMVVRGEPIPGKDAEVKHDGRAIYDTSVIVEYVDCLAATPKLIPAAFADRIEVKLRGQPTAPER